MNRIILIGNGFDLAHGLKTRYADFINYFWQNQLEEANKFEEWKVKNGAFVFRNDFFDLTMKEYKKHTDIAALKLDISSYNNNFLERIEKVRVIVNWVDLEELYYRELLNCLRIEKENNDAFVVSQIKKLNEDFESIRKEFESYLKEKIVPEIGAMQKIDEIADNIWNTKNSDNTVFTEHVLFLSFNYTDTQKFYEDSSSSRSTVIHIHGEINKSDNPMIFGYGDELAVDFKDIENTNRNEFLENAKSIKYLETDNYDRLLEFLGKEYEVFIFGHSCGNSDRTLLNTIFENDNCKKIRPFYHRESTDKDNYGEIVRNISRSFTKELNSKANLRQRVEKHQSCKPLYYEGKIKNDFDNFLNDNFVLIEGNNQEYALIEKPDKKQNINKFYIGKYQVTQVLYMQIMGCKNPSYYKGEKLPVEHVTWYDCAAFCNKLSEKYNLDTYYNLENIELGNFGEIKKAIIKTNKTAKGFRLLTENEWEYAARYKSRTDGKECPVYAGSTHRGPYDDDNELEKYAWFKKNSDRTTHEVGTAVKHSVLAIHDMSGNVWEWCEHSEGSYRVLRGGSWSIDSRLSRVSYRNSNLPGYRNYNLGFRLALSSN